VRNLLLASVVCCAVGASAHAADIPVKAALPPAALPYDWSGPYVGANFGGAWTSNSLNIPVRFACHSERKFRFCDMVRLILLLTTGKS
jgi:opacity protein-like surface antigen